MHFFSPHAFLSSFKWNIVNYFQELRYQTCCKQHLPYHKNSRRQFLPYSCSATQPRKTRFGRNLTEKRTLAISPHVRRIVTWKGRPQKHKNCVDGANLQPLKMNVRCVPVAQHIAFATWRVGSASRNEKILLWWPRKTQLGITNKAYNEKSLISYIMAIGNRPNSHREPPNTTKKLTRPTPNTAQPRRKVLRAEKKRNWRSSLRRNVCRRFHPRRAVCAVWIMEKSPNPTMHYALFCWYPCVNYWPHPQIWVVRVTCWGCDPISINGRQVFHYFWGLGFSSTHKIKVAKCSSMDHR